MIWVVAGGVVALLAVGLLVLAARRRRPDGVTTFQRQIDALSPDARRSVVRKVSDLRRNPRPDDEGEGEGPGQSGGVVGDPFGGRN